MALPHSTKVFGVREAWITKMLTDVAGSAATYASVTSTVAASPTPTTTVFAVGAGDGAKFTVGRVITIAAQTGVIQSIATDTITLASALTSAPTAGQTVTMTSAVRLIGSKALTLTPNATTQDLTGDNTYIDSDSVLHTVSATINYAKLSLDVLSLIAGNAVADSGTTPAQTTTWSLPNPPAFNSFRLEARCFATDTGIGDLHVVLAKCRATEPPLVGLADENYAMPTLNLRVIPPTGTTPWIQYVFNETAVQVA